MSKRPREINGRDSEDLEGGRPRASVWQFLDIEAAEAGDDEEEDDTSEMEGKYIESHGRGLYSLTNFQDDFIDDDGEDVQSDAPPPPPPPTEKTVERMSAVVRYGCLADSDVVDLEDEADTFRLYSRRWKMERDRERERVRSEACNGRKMWAVRSARRHTDNLNVAKTVDSRLEDDRPSCAFAVKSLPGRVYVLARSPSARTLACAGILGLYTRSALLLPREEQALVEGIFARQQDVVRLQPGEWVDIVRGQYRRSIARVRKMSDDTDEVLVAVVPYNPHNGQRAPFTLYDARALADREQELSIEDDDPILGAFTWNGLTFRKGLLELWMPATHHIKQRSRPPNVFEAGDFTQMEPYEDMIALSGPEPLIRPGDRVRIVKGELKNLEGVVSSCDDTTLSIAGSRFNGQAFDYGSSKPLSATIWEIERILVPGDNVRFRFGFLSGVGGLILTIAGDSVTFFSTERQRCVSYLFQVYSILIRTLIVYFSMLNARAG